MKIWSKLYNITVTIIHGIAIGIANLIPGVSGGTMAVVLGIYQTIIDALHAVFTWSSEKWNALRYLTILGTGAILSVIFLSKTFLWLIETRAQHLSFFFIGLIIGSIPGLWFSQDNIRVSGRNILTFLSSLLLMISITTLTPEAFALTGNPLQTHFLYLGFSGFIAGATMIVPGISGSLILLIMGTYAPILEAISSANISVIGVVGLGAVLGIVVISQLIHKLFKLFPGTTTVALIGLLLGSIPALWPGIKVDFSNILFLLITLGGILVADGLRKQK